MSHKINTTLTAIQIHKYIGDVSRHITRQNAGKCKHVSIITVAEIYIMWTHTAHCDI